MAEVVEHGVRVHSQVDAMDDPTNDFLDHLDELDIGDEAEFEDLERDLREIEPALKLCLSAKTARGLAVLTPQLSHLSSRC
mmetsp:Transcript_24278/g.41249  ORF Transcript_24278/g.41249 Transcript_24278/m.41249 type:complete len:81 (-) Transcript_24278:222-464(-)